jgi:hypothetical protein
VNDSGIVFHQMNKHWLLHQIKITDDDSPASIVVALCDLNVEMLAILHHNIYIIIQI